MTYLAAISRPWVDIALSTAAPCGAGVRTLSELVVIAPFGNLL